MPTAHRVLKVLSSLAGVALFSTSVWAGNDQRIDFNFHIRPILSDRCFKCHGPDSNGRKAGLRLDTPEGAYAVLDPAKGVRAITPKHPGQSEVIRRVTTTDPDEKMPPPESKSEITPQEVALLKRWIEQGAEYESHWAFTPVDKPSLPQTKSSWARNAIDQFIFERLRRERLKPGPEATKEALIRRVSLDLTGLPPSVAEMDSFLNDRSTNAFEKVVDRLLASPAYGEWMATEWLDLARYADTYGYQSDVDRDMSAWRDWVIRAFNDNMPYDEFVRWQLAGDLLPNATDEQILATAFNRLHRQTNEGGSIEEEFRTEYVADRVHTFGTAFLGLTLECARCHDHKYDPIKQRDYYSLFAFFNNIDESGLYSHFTQATPTPTLLLYGVGQKEKHREMEREIALREQRLQDLPMKAKALAEEWWKAQPEIKKPQPIARFNFEKIDGNKTASVVGEHQALLGDNMQQIDANDGKGIKFDGESSVICKDIAHFRRTDAFSLGLSIKPGERQPRAVVLHHSRAWTDSGSRGYELVLEDGKPTFALIHFWPGNAIAIRAREAIPLHEWSDLVITYDGSSSAAGLKVYRNGELMDCEIVRDHLVKDIVHRREWGDMDVGNVDLTLGARFRDAGFKNGSIDALEIFDTALTACEVRSRQAEKVPPAYSRMELLEHFLRRHHSEYRTNLVQLQKAREAENNFVNDIREIMVMKEMPSPRQTHLLRRGSYDAPAEPVQPGTPEKISPFPPDLPRNRLGLAMWTTDRRNPLTARVAVNRLWRSHFGRGLVATPEDFGSQGQLPTHPELLEWLASEFMDVGWDLKAMHRLIVTSATYRQSSFVHERLFARDPDNRLLARGPKHRLYAEQIRDAALAASGLLSRTVGGPSVKPYQPAGLWEQSGIAKSYTPDKGENLYRRSLYTFIRRTAPPPAMTTFDATSREVCTAKRQVTATPLQPLVLLNDPQFVEAARVLAGRVFTEERKLDDSIILACRHVLGRSPHRRELQVLRQLYNEQLNFFMSQTNAAVKYLKAGEAPPASKLPPEKAAAATVLVSTLMNHDEFVTKQ